MASYQEYLSNITVPCRIHSNSDIEIWPKILINVKVITLIDGRTGISSEEYVLFGTTQFKT